MDQLTTLLFWGSLTFVWYAYAGFPLLLLVLATLRRARPVQRQAITPRVSLLIAAYNEADVMADRIENALVLDYPPDLLEIIVASDGSTDATAEIVQRYRSRGVRLLQLSRRGKIPTLEAAVRESNGEIILFSDADTMCGPGAVRALVRNFADPSVGGAVAHVRFRTEPGSESSSHGERLYWRYDSWLKQLEFCAAGSVVSAAGSLYALRRELYVPPPDGAVTDDFTISTGVVAAGRRLAFEREAYAWAVTAPRAQQEFARRVRLMTRGLRALAFRRELLNPLRFGSYAVCLLSHKLVRRLVPLALIALLASTLALARTASVYETATVAQLGFYVLAGAGALTRRAAVGRWRCLYVPFFFCVANTAALIALLRYLRGDRIAQWQPQRSAV